MKKIKLMFIVVTMFVAACVETDIYLPAFPDMMTYFAVSEGEIQSLLSWNFAGICLVGPLYGPLSDTFGRKRPLLIALLLFLCGSLITLFTTSFDGMLWGRVLQGLGSGGCFVLGTAVLFDVFQKEEAVEATSLLNTIIPIIMAIAPLIGGYLNCAFGFRSNFLAITLLVLLSLIICCLLFKESLPTERRTPLESKKTLGDLKQMLSSLPFWQLTLAMSLPFAGYITFLSGTAVLFVVEFGMSKEVFPLIQALLLGGWVAGSLCLKKSLAKWGAPAIKRSGILLSAIGGVVLAAATWLTPESPGFVTGGMIFFAFGANWIIGLYFPEGMEVFPDNKGMAASILTSARLCIASAVLGLSSFLYNQSIYPLSFIVLATIGITIPILLSYERAVKRAAA